MFEITCGLNVSFILAMNQLKKGFQLMKIRTRFIALIEQKSSDLIKTVICDIFYRC